MYVPNQTNFKSNRSPGTWQPPTPVGGTWGLGVSQVVQEAARPVKTGSGELLFGSGEFQERPKRPPRCFPGDVGVDARFGHRFDPTLDAKGNPWGFKNQ